MFYQKEDILSILTVKWRKQALRRGRMGEGRGVGYSHNKKRVCMSFLFAKNIFELFTWKSIHVQQMFPLISWRSTLLESTGGKVHDINIFGISLQNWRSNILPFSAYFPKIYFLRCILSLSLFCRESFYFLQ